jgi:hypothetical protein
MRSVGSTSSTPDGDVHPRRNSKAKCFANLDKIQSVDIIYAFQRVRGIGLEIRSVTVVG